MATKPPIPWLDCDDYIVTVDGQDYTPHAGEPVQLVPIRSFAEMREYERFDHLAASIIELREQRPRPDADVSDPVVREQWRAYNASVLAIRDEQSASFEALCQFLSSRVLAIAWTNDLGQPILPWNGTFVDPATGEQRSCARIEGDPQRIAQLEPAEIHYLLNLQRRENPKNAPSGSSSSETPSSDSASPATEESISTLGHSLTPVG